MGHSQVPAGWYPDRPGEMRYWDGQAWTGHSVRGDSPQLVPTPVPARRAWRSRWQFWVGVFCVAFVALGAVGSALPSNDPATETISEPADRTAPESGPGSAVELEEAEAAADPPPAALLFVTDLKDGDSWDASDGQEYRLGLVNTPEQNEPCAADAAEFTRAFLASGFTTDPYSSDRYGRVVAEVFDPDGTSLNVALAASGLADDRYLDEFRYENPDLASRIEDALRSADIAACSTPVKAAPLVQQPASKPKPAPVKSSDCMTGYSPCLPVVADLDCGEIGQSVTVTGNDPYRLDRDGDGIGCD